MLFLSRLSKEGHRAELGQRQQHRGAGDPSPAGRLGGVHRQAHGERLVREDSGEQVSDRLRFDGDEVWPDLPDG